MHFEKRGTDLQVKMSILFLWFFFLFDFIICRYIFVISRRNILFLILVFYVGQFF